MATLYALSYSPWSERARWALDHHRIAYREVAHLPMLGEARLRLVTRRPVGKVTVPVLVDGDRVLDDSYAIALHAERMGRGKPLFPVGTEGDIAAWNNQSEALLAAGRIVVTSRIAESPDALAEAVPLPAPLSVRSKLTAIATVGTHFFAKKYGFSFEQAHGARATMREVLISLEQGLRDGKRYLLGDFTFADLTMAVALQCVSPVDDRYIRLGPATRACWRQADIAREFAPLVEWRDRIYRDHRLPT